MSHCSRPISCCALWRRCQPPSADGLKHAHAGLLITGSSCVHISLHDTHTRFCSLCEEQLDFVISWREKRPFCVSLHFLASLKSRFSCRVSIFSKMRVCVWGGGICLNIFNQMPCHNICLQSAALNWCCLRSRDHVGGWISWWPADGRSRSDAKRLRC